MRKKILSIATMLFLTIGITTNTSAQGKVKTKKPKNMTVEETKKIFKESGLALLPKFVQVPQKIRMVP